MSKRFKTHKASAARKTPPKPGKASSYIEQADIRPGLRVVLAARVCTTPQDRNNNPQDQEENLWQVAEECGWKIVGSFSHTREVTSVDVTDAFSEPAILRVGRFRRLSGLGGRPIEHPADPHGPRSTRAGRSRSLRTPHVHAGTARPVTPQIFDELVSEVAEAMTVVGHDQLNILLAAHEIDRGDQCQSRPSSVQASNG